MGSRVDSGAAFFFLPAAVECDDTLYGPRVFRTLGTGSRPSVAVVVDDLLSFLL